MGLKAQEVESLLACWVQNLSGEWGTQEAKALRSKDLRIMMLSI